MRRLKRFPVLHKTFKCLNAPCAPCGFWWDTVGGSRWEIQVILTQLFEHPIDEVLGLYRKKIKGMIEYYIGTDLLKEKVLRVFLEKETARIRDFIPAGISGV